MDTLPMCYVFRGVYPVAVIEASRCLIDETCHPSHEFGRLSFYCKLALFFRFATGGEDGFVRLHTFDKDYEDVEQRVFNVQPSSNTTAAVA